MWLAHDVIAYPADMLPDDGWGVSLELWSVVDPPPAGAASSEWPGATIVELQPIAGGIGPELGDRFPHLRYHRAVRPVGLDRSAVGRILTGAVQVVARRGGGAAGVLVRTGVQLGGVIDDLYAEEARARVLGADWSAGVPSLALWAPTARRVILLLHTRGPGAEPDRLPMERQPDGAWSVRGEPSWARLAYRYEVEVFVPSEAGVVRNVVTDPYSVALTTGSDYSVLVDLDDPAVRPPLWSNTPAPRVARPVDRVVYELHVRDFSVADHSVPPEHRGTYLAFAGEGRGVQHLRALAAAGLTTVQLLPVFDFASVPEDRREQRAPEGDLAILSPDGAGQQAAIAAVADQDGFNWGYDPLHYQVPEGSYATDGRQDGGARVAEARTMVGALHGIGLEVVLDQVFNHTVAHGQSPRSVLDRVVPGYYHRLDAWGDVHSSTCCSNVATERSMAEKLMVDTVVLWARHYRVDGFRFDLMGHHSRATMQAVRAALDLLTPEADGTEGRSIAMYGEGWTFGEVAGNALFVQASQGQLGGTGIGTFNDRLRDAVLGGSPVDGSSVQHQGFGTGLATDPNDVAWRTPAAERFSDLAHQADLVRLGLAGNLRDYRFTTAAGWSQRGEEIPYRGSPAGYADSPEEVVTYLDAHDNHTLFDVLTLKLPTGTSMDDRVRMAMLALSITMLAQTPVLWHAGSDLLRSKSLDRDSYNSGDWFNAIDWTGRDNGFGRGLPPAHRNKDAWGVYAPLLAQRGLRPGPDHIALAGSWARDLLALRFSTPLLRLGDPALIAQKVAFPGSGPGATPGVLVMHIDDRVGPAVDPALDGVLAVVNASPHDVTETIAALVGRVYDLSPVQQAGADAVVRSTVWQAATGSVTVPARTVALLVEPA